MDLYFSKVIEKVKSYENIFSLKNKTAIVVGGTRGLGLAMALGLGGSGANVVVSSRNITDELVSEIKLMFDAISANVEVLKLDGNNETAVEDFFKQVNLKYGSIDILINSQGSVYLEETTKFPLDKWQSVMDNNVKSVFLCCKHAAPYMISHSSGKIINVSSVRGFQGRAQDPAYATSKGAVNQLTKSLAIEWAPLGLNVNALAPVFTKTKISEDFLKDEERLNWVLGRIPQKRLGELEDIVGPAIFLASSASNFVNGQILSVDGGWLAG